MDILIKTKRIFSINNKDQRGDLFKKDEKNGKKNSPGMGFSVLPEQLKSLM